MMLFKLTDQNGYTRRGESGETQWKEGFTLTVPSCDNPKLCSSDVIHAYTNPNLAFILNPNHANIKDPQLWEAEGEIVVRDWEKVGCFSLTTTRQQDTPAWTKNCPQKVQGWFAILCAEAILKIFEYELPKDDRPHKAIAMVKEYLKKGADAAAATAADAAAVVTVTAYAAAAAVCTSIKIDFDVLADEAVKLAMEGEKE